eukprot:scaffold110745_cov65-Phaeocystis_antarctica.AAC.2
MYREYHAHAIATLLTADVVSRLAEHRPHRPVAAATQDPLLPRRAVPICHAYATRMPLVCHSYAMRMPCVCHAYTPVGSRPTGHPLHRHVPCTYHAYTMSHAPSSSSPSQARCRSGLLLGSGGKIGQHESTGLDLSTLAMRPLTRNCRAASAAA